MTPTRQVTVLFFGSFNPIHVGHLAVAEAALARPEVDSVWFVVTPSNPHKQEEGLAPAELRLALVRKVLEGLPGFAVCDIEFTMPPPHYTASTLRALESAYPKTAFSLLLGADNLRTLHTWRDAERLAAHSPLYVYPRHGADVSSATPWETAFPDVEVIRIPGELHPFSSTAVRAALACGEQADAMLPEVLRGDPRLAAAYGPGI
jgi:nicotinate-nucleotide adenylyltransferase